MDQDSARRRGNLQNARSRRYQHHHRRKIQKGTTVSGWKSVFKVCNPNIDNRYISTNCIKEWHHPIRGDIRQDLGECGRRDHHQGVPPAHRPQARHEGPRHRLRGRGVRLLHGQAVSGGLEFKYDNILCAFEKYLLFKKNLILFYSQVTVWTCKAWTCRPT